MQAFMRGSGWVAIPDLYRQQMGLEPGDVIDFYLEGEERLVLRKIESAHPPSQPLPEPDRFELARGSAGPGPTTDELMRMLRGDPEE